MEEMEHMFNKYVSGVVQEGERELQAKHFLIFSNITVLEWVTLLWGFSGHCSVLGSTLGLYTLAVSSMLPVVTTKTAFTHCQVQNRLLLRSIELKQDARKST